MGKIVETIKDVLIPELISIAKDTPKSWGEIILKRLFLSLFLSLKILQIF